MSTATLWMHFQRIGATSKSNPGKQNVGPFTVTVDPEDPAAVEHAIGVTARQHGANAAGALRYRAGGYDPQRPDAFYFWLRDSVTGLVVAHGPARLTRQEATT